jgi:mono/diheme cytochrome c family protein
VKIIVTIVLTLLLALLIGLGLVHSAGLTNFAADEEHPALVNATIEYLRERFIASRSKDIEVPDLDDPQRITKGGTHYMPMCAGCHLGPGTEDTEIRRGLYPQPPNLAQPSGHAGGHDHSDMKASAARQFWIIKHGIKMTGMPAWGTTHDDEAIWDLVAFLQKLPEMSPGEYAALSEGEGVGAHDHGSGHAHGGQEQGTSGDSKGHVDPPGTPPHSHEQPKKHSDRYSHSH